MFVLDKYIVVIVKGKLYKQTRSSESVEKNKRSYQVYAGFVSNIGTLRTVRNFLKKRKLDSRNTQETTTFVCLLKEDAHGNFRQEKDSTVPIEAEVSWG